MRIRATKWGNSLAVRIPRAYAEQIGVSEGAAIEITASGDTLVLRRPRYTLEALVAGVTPRNLHGETDWGSAVGREAW